MMTTDVHTSAARRFRRSRRLAAIVFIVVIVVIFVGSNRTDAPAMSGTSFDGPPPTSSDTGRLRVATFNIHSGRDAEGDDAWPDTIRTITDFDLIGLQEVRGSFIGKSQAQQLGEALSMPWCFAPSERRYWHNAFGNGALSTLPVRSWHTVPMVNTRGKGYRCYLEATIDLAGQPFTVLIAHLDRHEDRVPQLRTLGDRFLEITGPVILMGDLNTTRDDPGLKRLLTASGVVDPHEPDVSSLAARRIDWILARGFTVTGAGYTDLGASDHPCYWAEFELTPE